MPSVETFYKQGVNPEKVVIRDHKGTVITFFVELFVKSYSGKPFRISIADRDKRFANELAAYRQFTQLGCEFVPSLVDFSVEEQWFCVQRIKGSDLLKISQANGQLTITMADILRQIDAMESWLSTHRIMGLGTNIKDLILSEDGQLFLVDFEDFDQNNHTGPTIFDSVIMNLLERIFIRQGRSARLTPTFLRLTSGIFRHKPGKVARLFLPVVGGKLHDVLKSNLEAAKQRIKRFLGHNYLSGT